jgi:hypothetical protein
LQSGSSKTSHPAVDRDDDEQGEDRGYYPRGIQAFEILYIEPKMADVEVKHHKADELLQW